MTRRRLRLLLVLALGCLAGFVALPSATSARAAADTPLTELRSLTGYSTSGYRYENYGTSDVVELYVDGAGRLGIVTVDTEGTSLTVETRDPVTYAVVGPPVRISFSDAPLYGGFLAAPDGSFFVLLGRQNPQEHNDLDVVEVRHYDAAWSLLGTAHLRGDADEYGVYEPFDASGPELAVVGSTLLVNMGRTMYRSDDMLRHQGSLPFQVDIPTMQAASLASLSGGSAPYSSHSFNQLVSATQSGAALIDHGDAYPRGLQLSVLKGFRVGDRSFTSKVIFPFDGGVGDNRTGTTVSALLAGPSRLLTLGSSVPHRRPVAGITGAEASYRHNVYAISTDPVTGTSDFRWLTGLSPTGTATALEPRAAQLGPDRFAVLFSVRDGSLGSGALSMEYRLLDSMGTVLASERWPGSYFSPITDPVVVGDRLFWAGLAPRTEEFESSVTPYLYGLDITDPAHPVRLGESPTTSPTATPTASPTPTPTPTPTPSPTPGPESDATLQLLETSKGALRPSFTPEERSYRVLLGRRQGRTWLSATPTVQAATVVWRLGSQERSGPTVGLRVSRGGTVRIEVEVTSPDGTTRAVYTMRVRRR